MFVGATESAWWLRLVVIAVWGLVALFVVVGSVRQAEQVEQVFGRPKQRRAEQRLLARNRILPLLFKYGTGLPDHYEWRIFIYDRDLDRLIASYAPEGVASPAQWKVGQGAVGAAYKSGEYVLVRGATVSDATWGLTPEQQALYRRLNVVGAMPIRDEWNEIIGVLSAASETDDGQLATPDGQARHIELAAIVARIIRDLLTEG